MKKINPFLIIGWLAVAVQFGFVIAKNSTGNFICSAIAITSFLISIIYTLIKHKIHRRELIKDLEEVQERLKDLKSDKNKGEL